MLSNYKPFVDRMIEKYEGGYGWDRADAGGPTKYGITCYDLAEHRGQNMHSKAAWAPLVRDMQLSEAEDIYAEKYAKAIMFNSLRGGVDCVMMDYAVNSGIGRAIRVARVMTKSDYGTGMTPDLVSKINAMDPRDFINGMCDERMIFLRQLSNWSVFGRGWTARVTDLRAYALALVNKKPAPEPVEVPTVPKGTHVEPEGATATQGGIVTAAGAGVAGVFGSPWFWVLGIVVVGALLTAGWIYYKRSHQKRQDQVVILPPSISDATTMDTSGAK